MTTVSAPSTTRMPRRRWLQVSLRTLLVLMLVLGTGFGWLGRQVQRARAQREAAAAIEGLGGHVRYTNASGGRVRGAVVWLGKLFCEDLSRDIADVRLSSTQITDAGLAHFRELTNLRELRLDNTQVSDAGLAHLQELTQLEALTLNNTQVSDAGLAHLRGLTQLEGLSLYNTRASDVGLAHLRELTRLEGLFLDKTQVTDAGVAELQKALPNCKITR
jgi:hypothetical protein